MGFLFLVLTTGAMLIRPGELHPILQSMSIYEVMIVLTLLFSYQKIPKVFEAPYLERSPITVVFLSFMAMHVVCHIGNMQFEEAITRSEDYLKFVLYFLLLVSLVDSKKRFIIFLRWTTIFAAGCMVLAFLKYARYITIEGQENIVELTGKNGELLERMGGTGLFQDPNDLASLASAFVPPALYFALRRGAPFYARAFWLGLVVLFFQAIQATHSRGGLLALAGGIVGIGFGKFGKKGLFILPLLPLGLLFIGGRQGDLSISSGTGQSRIQHQHDGLRVFVSRPIFGSGPFHYTEATGQRHVAHNSYLQSFTELGFVGGALFASLFFCAIYTLWQVGWHRTILDPDLAQVRPFLIGLLISESAAKMSLSHTYMITTYMLFGMISTFTTMCETYPPIDRWFRKPLWLYVFGSGVGMIMFLYFYINMLVRYK